MTDDIKDLDELDLFLEEDEHFELSDSVGIVFI
jgi:hypothetical protein